MSQRGKSNSARKKFKKIGRPCRTCGQYINVHEARDHGQMCVYCAPPKIANYGRRS